MAKSTREKTLAEKAELQANIATFRLEAQKAISQGDYKAARAIDAKIASLEVEEGFRDQRLAQIRVEEDAEAWAQKRLEVAVLESKVQSLDTASTENDAASIALYAVWQMLADRQAGFEHAWTQEDEGAFIKRFDADIKTVRALLRPVDLRGFDSIESALRHSVMELSRKKEEIADSAKVKTTPTAPVQATPQAAAQVDEHGVVDCSAELD